MTNKELFMTTVREKGIKLQFLADKIGISRQALSNKINNHSQFNAREVGELKRLLALSQKEVDDIFFALDVDKITT